MWRKFIIIMISLILFTNLGVFASDNKKDNQSNNVIRSIAPYIYENENTNIRRGDCITTIMKLIGVDKDTAEMYNDMDFDQPVFYDIEYGDANTGYIILAKFSDVAVGVNLDTQNIGNFEPNRAITTKECLAFMLRCLKDPTTIEWENIIFYAEELGLLKLDEVQNLNVDEVIVGSTFKTLLERMLNMNRYLYWPTEIPPTKYTKSMQIDKTNSITYLEWIYSRQD